MQHHMLDMKQGYLPIKADQDEPKPADTQSSDGETYIVPPTNSGPRRNLWLLVFLLSATSIISTTLLIARHFRHRHDISTLNSPLQKPHLCGNTSQEALDAGCTFNQLLWSWMPPNCPSYANDEFLEAEEWKYYVDPLGKIIATGDHWTAAMNNDIVLWGQKGEHLTHCVFLFYSLSKIIRHGMVYTPILVGDEHVQHCVDFLLEELRLAEDWEKVASSVGRVRYDQYCF